jgi:hypothetical protein
MAVAGHTIYNPVTHERITFLRTSEDTNGKYFLFDCRVTPGGATLPVHIHRTQEERFTVVSGTLGVLLGSTERTRR